MSALRGAHPIVRALRRDLADDLLVPIVPASDERLAMTDIDVRCDGGRTDGWACLVTLGDAGREVSRHRVRVEPADLDRLAPGAADPAEIVEASFRFLLARESPASILGSFDLPVIGRYFPEYEAEIRAAYHRRRV
jgi:hypothetical protein